MAHPILYFFVPKEERNLFYCKNNRICSFLHKLGRHSIIFYLVIKCRKKLYVQNVEFEKFLKKDKISRSDAKSMQMVSKKVKETIWDIFRVNEMDCGGKMAQQKE